MRNEINYIAIARSGDLIGMAGKDEAPDTFAITTKAELKLWRTFNRANRVYLEACSDFVFAGCPEDSRAVDGASDAFSDASQALRDYLGDDVWSKWHARTRWVAKKVSN